MDLVRPAGAKLLQFAQTPMGEEVLEGTIAGGLTGVGMLFSEQDIRQTALQTALAIAGGIGVGMGGRRIGAYLGKKLHPGEVARHLPNGMESPLYTVGLGMGQESAVKGLKDLMAEATGKVQPKVTGEEIGRAAGRMFGDEVGVLAGLGAGLGVSQAIGIESPKDKAIRELTAELEELQGKK